MPSALAASISFDRAAEVHRALALGAAAGPGAGREDHGVGAG